MSDDKKGNALDIQVGGGHYKDMKIQPVEFCQAYKLPYCESTAIKYLCRHRNKNGRQDLEKARHFIDLLLDLEYPIDSDHSETENKLEPAQSDHSFNEWPPEIPNNTMKFLKEELFPMIKSLKAKDIAELNNDDYFRDKAIRYIKDHDLERVDHTALINFANNLDIYG